MTITTPRLGTYDEFVSVLEATINDLNKDANSSEARAEFYRKQDGLKLEPVVFELLKQNAIGTNYEDKIELVSGRSFPDIIADNQYGVEVKTSKKGWQSLGSSIMESSRVADIEDIFLLFGKLNANVEFKYKPYQDCLSDISVSHKPRYQINMELTSEQTIFEKMETDYNTFRTSDNPIGILKEYYKKTLKDGQDVWWIDRSDNDYVAPAVIKMWSSLDTYDMNIYIAKGFAYFPEILSKSNKKYYRFSLWLVKSQSILATSLRDSFSSKGKVDVITKNKTWYHEPRQLYKLNIHREDILRCIKDAEEDFLKEVWMTDTISPREQRLKQWLDIVIDKHCPPKNRDIIQDIFSDLL